MFVFQIPNETTLMRYMEIRQKKATNSLFRKLSNILSQPSENDVDKIVLAETIYEKLKWKKSAREAPASFELEQVSSFTFCC